MPLPKVSGWLLDFRTARVIAESESNFQINHCIEMCGCKKFRGTHLEKKKFSEIEMLKIHFVDNNNLIVPDHNIIERATAITASAVGKPTHPVDDVEVFLTATALSKNFGLISNHMNSRFVTVAELCESYGVEVLSVSQYFSRV